MFVFTHHLLIVGLTHQLLLTEGLILSETSIPISAVLLDLSIKTN